MPRDALPPRFKPWSPPKAPSIARQENAGRYRISPRKRGYNARWDKLSLRFRRARAFCLLCQQERPEEQWLPTAVVDHVLPAHEFPQFRYDWRNLAPMCAYHHDSTKARLEAHARKHGLLEMLPLWVWDPMSRPSHLRPVAVRMEYVVPEIPNLLGK